MPTVNGHKKTGQVVIQLIGHHHPLPYTSPAPTHLLKTPLKRSPSWLPLPQDPHKVTKIRLTVSCLKRSLKTRGSQSVQLNAYHELEKDWVVGVLVCWSFVFDNSEIHHRIYMEIVWTLFIGIGGGKKLRSLNEHHELFPVCHGTVWPVRRVWGEPSQLVAVSVWGE